MKDYTVHILLYRWAGRKLFWEIGSECEECDRSVQCVRELLETEFLGAPVKFELKNWLDHLSEALWHRAWHPPVILLNGRLFSQGVVPQRDRLVRAIRTLLMQNRPQCPVCRRILDNINYSSHQERETKHRVIRFIQAQLPELVSEDSICSHCLCAYEHLLGSQEIAT